MADKYPSLKEMCTRCKKRKTCKSLCAFAEKYVQQDGDVWEKKNENSIQVFSGNRIINQTSLHRAALEENMDKDVESIFGTDNESAFSSFQATNKGTQIFIHRFFKGWQFKDIAEKFDISETNAKSTYHLALQRFQDGLDVLDERKKLNNSAVYALQNSATFAQLSNNIKFYLLYVLFGLTGEEIADITGEGKIKVNKGVQYIAGKLKTGNYSLKDLSIPGHWEQTAKAQSRSNLNYNKAQA